MTAYLYFLFFQGFFKSFQSMKDIGWLQVKGKQYFIFILLGVHRHSGEVLLYFNTIQFFYVFYISKDNFGHIMTWCLFIAINLEVGQGHSDL